MDKIVAIKTFVRVAELESFSQAAQSLNLAKASVTIIIQSLESLLSVKLLERTTRRVQLTSEGKTFLERSKDILSDLEDIETMFVSDGAQITGKIRVDMTGPMARNTVIPRLGEFLQKFPGIEIELSSSERRVDLIREGIDCVVRGGKYSEPGLAERPLGELAIVNVASPSYLEVHGTPENLADLNSHKLIFFQPILGVPQHGFEYFDGEKYREIKMGGFITVNSADAYKAACLAGLGICQTPRIGVADELKSGMLTEILPNFRAEPMLLKLVYPQRRMLAKRVRVFIDWLEPVIKQSL